MAENNKPIALEDRGETGEKLFSPSAGRNKDVIAETLGERLARSSRILEIGSGTGEHAEAVCLKRPDLRWTPSDPDARSRASIAARSREIDNLAPPLALDLLDQGWMEAAPECDALVCINVIHISPFDVTRALAGFAASRLPGDGCVILYGPFLEGVRSAPSNLTFRDDLQRRDPQWGVRELDDVKAVFAGKGWRLDERIAMPANNLTLVFKPD